MSAGGYTGRNGISMQVSKWGNSLAIRLPAAIVEALKLKEGDEIEISISGRASSESIVIEAVKEPWHHYVAWPGLYLPVSSSIVKK